MAKGGRRWAVAFVLAATETGIIAAAYKSSQLQRAVAVQEIN
jgi:hypothetical protein